MTGRGASGSIISTPSAGAPLDWAKGPNNRPMCRQFAFLADSWPIAPLAALGAAIGRAAPAH